jgi:hypothetical protein
MTAVQKIFATWKPECGFVGYERLAVAIVRGDNNLLFRRCLDDCDFAPGQIILWGGSPNKLIHSPQQTILRKLERKLGVANVLPVFVDHFQKIEKRHGVEGNIFVFDVVLPDININVTEGSLFLVPEKTIKQCVLIDDLSLEAPNFSELPEYKDFSLFTREVLKFYYSLKT